MEPTVLDGVFRYATTGDPKETAMNNWASALEIHHQQHEELIRVAAARSQVRHARRAARLAQTADSRPRRAFWHLGVARLSA